ncbi:calponin homology domain-containing protein [Thamnocephalis sphaerospora]|uniref:Calponin homology domain-containing protein n=1 Tax=Thamnocephalis sphaerospora TaxID=78915 RepID=A0A4P9XT23_9FUNG|nr:calponin homology domain-containing protein [Thamnocephalis sphaerospora]|eukprot:RKP09304.1 calponin homology domain-containing protein [Thamnocephalis sphaerospora]
MTTPFEQSAASQEAQNDLVLLLDKAWEDVQQRTFTKWVSTKLATRGLPSIEHLDKLSDGTVLIQLLEIIGDTTLGRYNKNPRLRIQQVENVNKALEFIKFRGINLTNIGAEDITDGNTKLILGLIWTIILRFTIAEISQEGLTAKEGLLLWCQRKTANYHDVNVRDFTFSWADGLAFCALIHCHRPDLLDYHSLDKSDRHANTALAFEVAESQLGIPKLLDVADVCDMAKPDERSIMTYVAQYFHAFSALGKVDAANRRVTKFADMMKSAWEMENDYERRVKKLMADITSILSVWRNASFDGTYVGAKRQSAEFIDYKTTTKRTWVAEKHDVDTLLGNIQTKLKTYNLKPYHPPTGLTLQDLDQTWQQLLQGEVQRRQKINKQIREVKQSLEQSFAKLANDFQESLNSISGSLAALDGDLQATKPHAQLNSVKSLSNRVGSLETSLDKIRGVNRQCQEANIEENDYTIYSMDDLTYDLSLLKKALSNKAAFIENQIVSRNMTNLTPAQLEEFESAFRFFDKDNSNTLTELEFKACLAGLGYSYSDDEFTRIFQKCTQGREECSFEQFTKFMVSITEDQTTPDQLRESFKAVAGDKEYITELELKRVGLPADTTQYLAQVMPNKDGEQGHLDYLKFLDNTFAA